jgi:hypothetical protein
MKTAPKELVPISNDDVKGTKSPEPTWPEDQIEANRKTLHVNKRILNKDKPEAPAW